MQADPPLCFSLPGMHSAVLATAEEENERGRDRESSIAGGGRGPVFVKLIHSHLTIFNENGFILKETHGLCLQILAVIRHQMLQSGAMVKTGII